jgi:glycerol-3-phosphate dehydrogenase (NAD(P)+)
VLGVELDVGDDRGDNRCVPGEEMSIGVVGGGSWGTALAAHLAEHHGPIVLWARESEVVDGINGEHHNRLFLSDVTLPSQLTSSPDIDAVVRGSDLVVSAVPVQFLRATFDGVEALASRDIVVTVSKGIEAAELATPHQILRDLGVADERIVALSGPSFAREVAEGRPSAVVAAGRDADRVARVQQLFSQGQFRVYASDDIVGVEIGGALKNVVALAAGVSDGLELGDNTRAAVITRGLAEIMRLGVALGGHPATFAGLSGVGDLTLTSAGGLSRNRRVGLAIGSGRTLDEIRAEMNEVAEGVPTCRSARELAARVGVELPITEQMYLLLYEGKDPRDALRDLLGRDLRDERDSPSD